MIIDETNLDQVLDTIFGFGSKQVNPYTDDFNFCLLCSINSDFFKVIRRCGLIDITKKDELALIKLFPFGWLYRKKNIMLDYLDKIKNLEGDSLPFMLFMIRTRISNELAYKFYQTYIQRGHLLIEEFKAIGIDVEYFNFWHYEGLGVIMPDKTLSPLNAFKLALYMNFSGSKLRKRIIRPSIYLYDKNSITEEDLVKFMKNIFMVGLDTK